MGFDVRVMTFEGHAQVHTTVYFSYNWASFKYHEGKPFSDIWYMRNDMHDRPSSEVQANLERALAVLKERNVAKWDPDCERARANSSWGWGVNMSVDDQLSVFQYHLEYFLQIAKQYPDAYFVDEETDVFVVNGKKYKTHRWAVSDDDSQDEDENEDDEDDEDDSHAE